MITQPVGPVYPTDESRFQRVRPGFRAGAAIQAAPACALKVEISANYHYGADLGRGSITGMTHSDHFSGIRQLGLTLGMTWPASP